MNRDTLVWASAREMAALVRAKDVSPLELTDALLERIEAVDPRLNAYAVVTADVARAAAREAEIAVMKGEPLGALHGVPVAIDDMVFTKGIRTTAGSRLFAQTVPSDDAVAVGRLRAAGAVILGKTNTAELAHKAWTDSPLLGPSRNPWNPTLTAGGASGGAAAAVGAAMGPLAIALDGDGGLRIPAAYCGVVGFKPSYGRVPQHPRFPGWQRLGHLGALARTVRDVAALLDVIGGGDPRDRESLSDPGGSYVEACETGIEGLHVAWTPDLGYATVTDDVRTACEDAAADFERLGCWVEVVNPAWENPEAAFSTILAVQLHAAYADELERNAALLDPSLARLIERGASIGARTYLEAFATVEQYWQEVLRFLERFDLLLTPTVAVMPFAAGARPPREIDGVPVSALGWMPFTYPFNLTGQPAASVPAAWTAEGLPVGLQIVGQRHADRVVLAASAAYEAIRPWAERRPA